MIHRKEVESSNIKSYGHDATSQLIHVEYANGDVWEYGPTTKEEYERLEASGSKGGHIARFIKPGKTGRKLSQEELRGVTVTKLKSKP